MVDKMPIIRVRRKRSASPQAALILEKKRRKDDPLLFSLFKSVRNDETDCGISGARVIEFELGSLGDVRRKFVSVVVSHFIMGLRVLFEIGSDHGGSTGLQFIAEHDDGTARQNNDSMEKWSSNDTEESVEYDYYKIYRGSFTEPINHWNSELELRFATEEEQSLLLGNSDSESDRVADDDDDSNDENNWRNDYPEEEDGDDTDNDSVDHNMDGSYSRGHLFNDYNSLGIDQLRRRLEMFEVVEYEADEDISDDDPVLAMRRCVSFEYHLADVRRVGFAVMGNTPWNLEFLPAVLFHDREGRNSRNKVITKAIAKYRIFTGLPEICFRGESKKGNNYLDESILL
ncbi:unnamed protein product [Angiostrongylus costaricensis]|uniref:Probable RNA polymerase II nuclear localization protein SLC7A6OS n=1 Tax=Angiostrongylus costaricensis TaxID=334426 RepID=A0A0R3PEV3_ANGCS|nr:unnamed protein product [Angiostrongylus costaricensis]